MAGRYELRFSGAGGQGLILAGVILAEAASIYQGIQAVQSQSYGPEARGGASNSSGTRCSAIRSAGLTTPYGPMCSTDCRSPRP